MTGTLRGVDLNLLPVLHALLTHRNVSRAARDLGMSQSAVSAALARLRRSLGDEILVQVGRRMEATDRARDLVERVEAAVVAAEAVWHPTSFDPGKAVQRFVIATADYVSVLLGPAVIRRMAMAAPGCTVQFVDSTRKLLDLLRAGEVDFAIIPRFAIETLSLDEMPSVLLFRDRFVAVAAADTPANVDPFAAPHVTFRMGFDPYAPAVARVIAGHDGDLPLAHHFQQFSVLPLVALESGTTALVQWRLAVRMMRHLPLRIVPSPVPTETIEIRAVWSAVHHADPAHRWFLDLLRAVVAEACPGEPPEPV